MRDILSRVSENALVSLSVVGIASAAGGFTMGYIFATRKNKAEAEETVEVLEESSEVDDAQLDIFSYKPEPDMVPWTNELDQNDPPTKQELFEKVDEEDPDLDTDEEEPPESSTSRVSVFGQDPDLPKWNWQQEKEKREHLVAYPIKRDEFEEEDGFDQLFLRYYTLDDVAVEEGSETPVYNPTEVLGELTWGLGSGDKNLVYVFNARLGLKYEVTRVEDAYLTAVTGVRWDREED